MIVSPSYAIERARRYLAALPPAIAGQRGHDATFAAACTLIHGFALNEDVAYSLLSEFNLRCLPLWSEAELVHKIRSAVAAGSAKPRGYLLAAANRIPSPSPQQPPSKWPLPDADAINRIIAAGPTALQLWERSPRRLEVDDGSNCEEIVRTLFISPAVPDPLLCMGKTNAEFATRPLSGWLKNGTLSTLALVVPSPMSAPTGTTRDGRESAHALDNTGPRRFIVVEFDQGTANDHAARLWHLAEFGPLAVVVHSGGKSLHGWFYCTGWDEGALRKFMVYAVSIGADHATWTRSQFVRLPGGLRDSGCRQSIFYFNPAAIRDGKEAADER